ncbi:MAG: hypothetical protein JWO25_2038, partial [Alphaproteobacteria bacterium]|nr:hypothetical protein [Alphaproteobacteria bacterium]
LATAGLASDFREGVALAQDSIRAGEPYRRLRMFVEATRG